MAYLIEQAALLADEHTAFDVGDQHPQGYASYVFTSASSEKVVCDEL